RRAEARRGQERGAAQGVQGHLRWGSAEVTATETREPRCARRTTATDAERSAIHSRGAEGGSGGCDAAPPSFLTKRTTFQRSASAGIFSSIDGIRTSSPSFRPVVIFHRISPSVSSFWSAGEVRSSGSAALNFAAGPSPLPLSPWHIAQCFW